MKLLITGASSYVGAKIYTDLKKKFDVIGTYYTNKLFPELESLDIRNKVDVENFIQKIRPDIIIHIAANPSGSWCEQNPEQALAINQEGTKNIADAANKFNAKVIFISSLAIANTDNLYGRTKFEGENFVKKVGAGYVILRPSLIVGFSPNTTNDRPFNRLLKNITEQTPAIYDTSWKFQPTWLKHISEVIETIIKKNIVNEIIPICVSEIKTRFDIANDILPEFNIKVMSEDKNDQSPIFSDDLKKLKELKLPFYTYIQMVKGIKEEIKSYLKNK
jgi:dTDP-4-dehydrorhamnose reductase